MYGRGRGGKAIPKEPKHSVEACSQECLRRWSEDLQNRGGRMTTKGKYQPAILDRWVASNLASHSRGGTAPEAIYPASYPSIWAASIGASHLSKRSTT